MNKLKILVLDDVPQEQKWAIAALVFAHPDSAEILEMKDKVALAHSLFDIQTERVAKGALDWLKQQNNQKAPADLVISDINLSEIKDLPVEDLVDMATETGGIDFAIEVEKIYPDCKLILFTAYIERFHRQLRNLELSQNVSIKNKAGDLSQVDLEELVTDNLQNIARQNISQYARNETRRRNLARQLEQGPAAGTSIEAFLQSIVLEDSDISLYHLLAGFGRAHYDQETQSAVLRFPENIIDDLLKIVQAEPFRTNFDPNGKPGRNLGIFESYCRHPLHAIWSNRLDESAKAIIAHFRARYKDHVKFVSDEAIYQQLQYKNIEVQAVNGAVSWPEENETPSKSFEVFKSFLLNRRVVLGLYHLKTALNCSDLAEWNANEIATLAFRLTNQEPKNDFKANALRVRFFEYMGFHGSPLMPQIIRTEVPYILAEERAFLDAL